MSASWNRSGFQAVIQECHLEPGWHGAQAHAESRLECPPNRDGFRTLLAEYAARDLADQELSRFASAGLLRNG